MDPNGLVVMPGKGRAWKMAPGRSSTLKLRNGETGESVMIFEEVAPVGTVTPMHLHHDSDEVAYVLSGEITFKIGDAVTVGGPGTCAFMPHDVAHAWKSTGAETPEPSSRSVGLTTTISSKSKGLSTCQEQVSSLSRV